MQTPCPERMSVPSSPADIWTSSSTLTSFFLFFLKQKAALLLKAPCQVHYFIEKVSRQTRALLNFTEFYPSLFSFTSPKNLTLALLWLPSKHHWGDMTESHVLWMLCPNRSQRTYLYPFTLFILASISIHYYYTGNYYSSNNLLWSWNFKAPAKHQ